MLIFQINYFRVSRCVLLFSPYLPLFIQLRPLFPVFMNLTNDFYIVDGGIGTEQSSLRSGTIGREKHKETYEKPSQKKSDKNYANQNSQPFVLNYYSP